MGKQKIKQQSLQIKELELASTRDTSITFNEYSYLHEMSGILDITFPAQSEPNNHQKILLQTSEEKMKLLKELEKTVSDLRQKNKELNNQLKRKKNSAPKPLQSKTKKINNNGDSMLSLSSMDSDDTSSTKLQSIPDLKGQISDIRASKENMRRRYERDLNSSKKKNQELQQKLWELTSNGDTEKIMNENQDLRRKLHEQRTEMQQLKSWKTMA